MQQSIMKGLLLIMLAVIFSAIATVLPRLDFRVSGEPLGFTVVVDAGHGGKDRGASSRGGLFESDINLAIALFLKRELEVRGINVVMTRETSHWLASPHAPNKKRDDMANRKRIIQNANPDVVVSIHMNTFPNPGVRGLQTFYNPKDEKSQKFATAIQNEFNNSELNFYRVPRPGNYYILDQTGFTGVLVECGFLSNAEDERLFSQSAHQRIIAYYIAKAVVRTLVTS